MPHQGRKIIHIDMDAFYAAVEQRDYPELRGKPIAVGGSSGRGVVMTASYEARKFGVKSAMPTHIARERCPNLIFVKSHMDKYREASEQIREIFYTYTDLVEPLSLDEAYLDVTENKLNVPYASDIAKSIRQKIFEKTGLTASAGISYNKFIAKLASDFNKPDGQTVIRPDQAQEFLQKLPIEKFHGVGKVTAGKMREMGIVDGLTLKNAALDVLVDRFGKAGRYFYYVVRGEDNREVKPDRVRKSVGAEKTFGENKRTIDDLKIELNAVIERLVKRLEKVEREGFTLTLKLKTSDFKIVNRSITAVQPLSNPEYINKTAYGLLETIDLADLSYRLIGLKVSNFKEDTQINMIQSELMLGEAV